LEWLEGMNVDELWRTTKCYLFKNEEELKCAMLLMIKERFNVKTLNATSMKKEIVTPFYNSIIFFRGNEIELVGEKRKREQGFQMQLFFILSIPFKGVPLPQVNTPQRNAK